MKPDTPLTELKIIWARLFNFFRNASDVEYREPSASDTKETPLAG